MTNTRGPFPVTTSFTSDHEQAGAAQADSDSEMRGADSPACPV